MFMVISLFHNNLILNIISALQSFIFQCTECFKYIQNMVTAFVLTKSATPLKSMLDTQYLESDLASSGVGYNVHGEI